MSETGRPTVMTQEVIEELEKAFLVGATDKEACFLAKISPATLYNYCQENKEFLDRKEALKDMVKYRARLNIATAINEGDKSLSQWYLERKAKDEFSQKTEQDLKVTLPTPIDDVHKNDSVQEDKSTEEAN